MIPDEVVDRVRNETDVVSIVGEFVKLKRVGNSYRGPCPFHHGKNPNFSVTDRGYNCFKCGESGDVFTFVQKHLGLDFVESVKWVGARSGVEVTEVSRRGPEVDSREPLWEVNATAAEFFKAELWDAPEGRTARDYLASRGISQEDADRFGIGYAPRDSATMRAALRTLGFDDERQVAAGVLRQQENAEPRARFRGRLMFPIYDLSGHCAGFGGRILGQGEPKYLNSSDSVIFNKRTLLYGLNWAKNSARKADRIVVVEGYFDAIRLMLAGIGEVVAPMGTAMTEEQAALVKKYTRNVYLLYDSDQAGLAATFKSGDKLLAEGVEPRVITLPDGEDPDTYVAKHGAEGFERAAADAVDVFERKVQLLERGGWFRDVQRKRKALDKMIPTIRVTADQILRDLYISRTSEVAGVSREMLTRELATAPRERRAPRENVQQPREFDGPPPQFVDGEHNEHDEDDTPPPVRRRERRADHRALGVRAERELVRMLLHQRRFADVAAERVGADMFADPVYRAIFTELTTRDHEAPVDEIAAGLDEEATEVLQELMNEYGGMERVEEAIEGSINSLMAREVSERLDDLDRLIPVAGDRQNELLEQKQKIAAEMRALKPMWKGFNRPK